MQKGKVVSIEQEETLDQQKIQIITVDTGDGKTVTAFNDYKDLSAGDKVFVERTDGGDYAYQVVEIDRMTPIIFLSSLFLIVLVVFGRKQGVRGLISLIFSLLLIFNLLIPGIIAGQSAIFLSLVITLFIVTVGSFITHGFNKTTLSATIGMGVSLIFTAILSYITVKAFGLTGLDSEESYYLISSVSATIDLNGILLGGILIGILGVLYDAAIGQSVAVEELWRANRDGTSSHIYKRAERMGREHIGALVNTLAIAYVGVSLPILLLIYTMNDVPLSFILSREIFATEIVRTLVGSIGIILTVPITTLVSVFMLRHLAGKADHSGREALHTHTH